MKVASGVKVVSPVKGFTLQFPSPGTLKPVTSPFGSTITLVAPAGITKLTVVGSTVPSGSESTPFPLSLFTISIVIVVPETLSKSSSSVATGGNAI